MTKTKIGVAMARKCAFYDGDVALLRDEAKGLEYELKRLKRLIVRSAHGATVGESAKLLPVIADSAQQLLVKVQRLAAHSYTIASPTRALPPSGSVGGKRRHAKHAGKLVKGKSRLGSLADHVNRLVRS